MPNLESQRNVVILQARMSSQRLPGKVLMPIDGKPSLLYQTARLHASKLIDDIIIATTDQDSDTAIQDFCDHHQFKCFRGSLHDVLKRYYDCAVTFQLQDCLVIRITGDCPLIDPEIVDEVIRLTQKHREVQYASNVRPATFPDGMDIEAIRFEILKRAHFAATDPYDREHVTPWIFREVSKSPNLWSNLSGSPDYSSTRLTLDYLEDYEVINEIATHCGPKAKYLDYVNYLQKNPQLVKKTLKFRAR